MGASIPDVTPQTVLKLYDLLYICTAAESIARLHMVWSSVTFTALDAGWEFAGVAGDRALAEVVLDGLCPLINEKLVRTRKTETTYSANIIAVRPWNMQSFSDPTAREEQVGEFVKALRTQSMEDMHKFRVGDNLLLDVPRNFYETYRDSGDFTSVRMVPFVDDEDEEDKKEAPKSSRNMAVSGIILVMMVCLVATNTVPLLQASLLATFALVSTGCLPQQDAFNAIKIRTVLTIVGAFGIGKAMGSTNVARVLATQLGHLLLPFGSTGVYTAIFVATVGLGIVFHATAVVILMFPICLELHHPYPDVPLHRCLAMLMIGAGCQMLSPVSYQTNLMAYASGHYTFADFPKVGIGMVCTIGVVAVCTVDQLV